MLFEKHYWESGPWLTFLPLIKSHEEQPNCPLQWMYASRCQVSGGLNMRELLHYSTSCLDTPTVCLPVSDDHQDNSSLWLLTCGGLRRDGGPAQSGSGEQDIVTLLPQSEDPTQHDTFTDTHKHTHTNQKSFTNIYQ